MMGKKKVQTIVLGGGQGKRLFPLTKSRCKPAVPIGGQYRLVDIAISNSIHSGYNQIYLLTQYHTRSLHRHIAQTYRFDPFSGGFVEILPAEQVNGRDHTWYEGTADAVRKNLDYFDLDGDDLVFILAGDHIYRMDFSAMVAEHLCSGAEVTISGKILPSNCVRQFGVMELSGDMRVRTFVEKPNSDALIRKLLLPKEQYARFNLNPSISYCVASMGNYLFRFSTLCRALEGRETDFGMEVLPNLVRNGTPLKVHLFDGYWEDIGSIRSFFDANLSLTDIVPPFDFFDSDRPIFTKPRYLPASKVNGCTMEQVVLGAGCLIDRASLRRCVIGIRSVIRQNSHLENVVIVGNGFFEKTHSGNGVVPCGIGKNCHIRNAILDKNVCIGDRVRISPENKPNGYEYNGCMVIDGIACIPRGTSLPNDFIL
ncbi:MAG: glucose-1-phosphate adenylyltransferase [Puniceicoccales bacterium]|jgi:glucose-1-phosphate adenylyltransferase|nr:glucose-1-phosphate adenylyltransferase [Puniceicoccales bacterium]